MFAIHGPEGASGKNQPMQIVCLLLGAVVSAKLELRILIDSLMQ